MGSVSVQGRDKYGNDLTGPTLLSLGAYAVGNASHDLFVGESTDIGNGLLTLSWQLTVRVGTACRLGRCSRCALEVWWSSDCWRVPPR